METGSALQTILYFDACAAAILARVGMETGFVNIHLGSLPFLLLLHPWGPTRLESGLTVPCGRVHTLICL